MPTRCSTSPPQHNLTLPDPCAYRAQQSANRPKEINVIFCITHLFPGRCKAGYQQSTKELVECDSIASAAALAILSQPPYGSRFGGTVSLDGKVVFKF